MKPLLLPSVIAAASLVLAACDHAEPPTGGGPGAEQVWSFDLPAVLPQTVVVDEREPTTLFVAAKRGGLIVLEDNGDSADELARLEATAFDGHHVMNLDQQGDLLVAAHGDFFGSAARGGVATIDISEPTNPVILDVWTTDVEVDGAADVLIDGSTIYLAMMAEGIGVFDASDPAALEAPVMLPLDPDFPRANPNPTAVPNARGLALEGDHLFVAYDAGGLRVVDVSDPAAPAEVARHIIPGVRTQQAYNDLVLHDGHAFISLDYCGLEVVDLTDPTDPRHVAWSDPWDCDSLANLWVNSAGHTNQIVHDPGSDRLWVSAGGAEMVTFDVSDITAPRHIASYGTRGNEQGTYGIGGSADRVYLTYIRTIVPFPGTWSGIVALDPEA